MKLKLNILSCVTVKKLNEKKSRERKATLKRELRSFVIDSVAPIKLKWNGNTLVYFSGFFILYHLCSVRPFFNVFFFSLFKGI